VLEFVQLLCELVDLVAGLVIISFGKCVCELQVKHGLLLSLEKVLVDARACYLEHLDSVDQVKHLGFLVDLNCLVVAEVKRLLPSLDLREATATDLLASLH